MFRGKTVSLHTVRSGTFSFLMDESRFVLRKVEATFAPLVIPGEVEESLDDFFDPAFV